MDDFEVVVKNCKGEMIIMRCFKNKYGKQSVIPILFCMIILIFLMNGMIKAGDLKFDKSGAVLNIHKNIFSHGEPDSTEADEENNPWSIIAQIEYETASTSKGLDLSATNPTLTSSASIYHEKGWNAQVSYVNMIGSESGPLSWSIQLGYKYNFTQALSLNSSYYHYNYYVSSVNALSSSNDALSFKLESDLAILNLSAEFEYYFGTDPAKFFTFEAYRNIPMGRFSLDLDASVSIMSQNIDQTLLDVLAVKLKKKNQTASGGGKTKSTISGLSSIAFDAKMNYDLTNGFTVYIDPTFLITPKGEVSAKSNQLTLQLGIEYNLDF